MALRVGVVEAREHERRAKCSSLVAAVRDRPQRLAQRPAVDVAGYARVSPALGSVRPSDRGQQLQTFSLRGGTTGPNAASTSNFARTVFAPRPHIPHELTPLRTTNRTTDVTRSAEVPNLDSTIAPGFLTGYRVSWQRRGPL